MNGFVELEEVETFHFLQSLLGSESYASLLIPQKSEFRNVICSRSWSPKVTRNVPWRNIAECCYQLLRTPARFSMVLDYSWFGRCSHSPTAPLCAFLFISTCVRAAVYLWGGRTDGGKIRQEQQVVSNQAQLLQTGGPPEAVEGAEFIKAQIQDPQLR